VLDVSTLVGHIRGRTIRRPFEGLEFVGFLVVVVAVGGRSLS